MQGRSQAPKFASLVAALGLGAALGCGPAHGGDSVNVNVSAVVLARVTCSFTGPGSELAFGNGASPVSAGARFPCASSNAATTYRIRRVTDARAGEINAASRVHANAVVLSIEP